MLLVPGDGSQFLPYPQLTSRRNDAENRLTSASVTGGADGLYSETYGYNETTGNLTTKGSLSLSYGSQDQGAPAPNGCQNESNPRNIAHAVSAAGGNTYQYDCNGNMTQRVIGSSTYNLSYDAENRLVSMSGPSLSASFVYDGDGNRVQSTINGVTTTFVGNYYEVTGSTVTKYYYAGSSRVAMNVNGAVYYLLSDQLGSTSITALGDGTKVSELRYKAWGEIRYSSGTTATNYQYTGQYAYESLGLDFYVARFYDPALGRFISADTVVSAGVQGYDRYAYANNSPVVYVDPTGHAVGVPPTKLPCEDSTTGCRPGNGNNNGGGGGGNGGSNQPSTPKPSASLKYLLQIMGFDNWQVCQTMIGSTNVACDPDTWTMVMNGLRSGPYSLPSLSYAFNYALAHDSDNWQVAWDAGKPSLNPANPIVPPGSMADIGDQINNFLNYQFATNCSSGLCPGNWWNGTAIPNAVSQLPAVLKYAQEEWQGLQELQEILFWFAG